MNLSFTEKKNIRKKFWKIKGKFINSKSYRSSEKILIIN